MVALNTAIWAGLLLVSGWLVDSTVVALSLHNNNRKSMPLTPAPAPSPTTTRSTTTTSSTVTGVHFLSHSPMGTTRRCAVTWLGANLFFPLLSSCHSARADDMGVTVGAGPQVRGINVTPFNGLIFNYRGSDNPDSSIKANELGDEPSISYLEFCEKLKTRGEVEFVEFLAPHGEVAYATIKGLAAPIRIGEGYPKEQPDGWSSPVFAIRTVQNAGVPYKFTVPGLGAYQNKSS